MGNREEADSSVATVKVTLTGAARRESLALLPRHAVR